MNNRISCLFLAITVLFVVACRKEYNCQCQAINPYFPSGSTSGGYSNFIVKGTEKKAKKECEEHSTEPDQYGNKTVCRIID